VQGLITSSKHITTVAMLRLIGCFRAFGSICFVCRIYSVELLMETLPDLQARFWLILSINPHAI